MNNPDIPKLVWTSVEAGGSCAYPEVVAARVPGGVLYAGTNWDAERDRPGPWALVLVPTAEGTVPQVLELTVGETPPRDCPECDYSLEEHRHRGSASAEPADRGGCRLTQEDLTS